MAGETIFQGPIEFEAITPLDGPTLVEHVENTLSLRLPELRDLEYPREGVLRIIANGPSARRAPLDGPTLALNGALKLFTERGLAPAYWMAADPQELVASFLHDAGGNFIAPASTHYLVASKCHPAVFDALLKHGRQVTVFHLNDHATWRLVEDLFPVGVASTVTITAFEPMARLGWRAFETWGWDGCFLGDQRHAVPQEDNKQAVEVRVGPQEKLFISTGSWCLEAQDAMAKLGDFHWPLTICGGGMIAEIMSHAWAERVREVIAKALAA